MMNAQMKELDVKADQDQCGYHVFPFQDHSHPNHRIYFSHLRATDHFGTHVKQETKARLGMCH